MATSSVVMQLICMYRLARTLTADVVESTWCAMAGRMSSSVHASCRAVMGTERLSPPPMGIWSCIDGKAALAVSSLMKVCVR